MTQKLGVDVKATFDGSDVLSNVNRLNAALENLGKHVEGIKITPIDPAAFSDVAKLQAELSKVQSSAQQVLKVLSSDVKKRIAETGQSGAKDVFQIDWNKIFLDAGVRGRQLKSYLQHIFQGTELSPATFSTPGGTPKLSSPKTRPLPAQPEVVSMVGRTLEAGLNAAGPVGSAVVQSIRKARAASSEGGIGVGLGAGLGSFVGSLAALGVGKLVGGIREHVDRAGQQAVTLDTLKRQLGDVGVSFDELRTRVAIAAEQSGVSLDEAAKAASNFARDAGLAAKSQAELSKAIPTIVGFARSFGLDVGQSGALFGAARRYGVSSGAEGDRRLALMIGEAVGHSGGAARTDELVAAVTSFMATQARMSLSAANMGGYLGSLSGLMASGRPGLDAGGSAALLAQVNSAVARGGMAGNTSQNFSLYALSRHGRLNPFETQALMEQGAFGRPQDAFGPGSVYRDFARKYGLRSPGAGDGKGNLQVEMEQLARDFADKNAGMMAMALSRHLGVSQTQAMALLTYGPKTIGAAEKRLGAQGMSLNGVNASGISAIGQILSGSPGALAAQVQALRASGKLSSEELQGLNGSGKSLEDLVLKLTAKYGQEETEGTKTRDSINAVDRTLDRLATGLIGPTNTMRDALVLLAGGGTKGEADIIRELAKAERDSSLRDARTKRDAVFAKSHAVPNASGRGFHLEGLEGRAAAQAEYEAAEAAADARMEAAIASRMAMMRAERGETAAGGGGDFVHPMTGQRLSELRKMISGRSQYDTLFEKSAGDGVSATDLKMFAALESSMDPNSVSPSGAVGLMQVMPGNFAAGTSKDAMLDPATNIQTAAAMIKRLYKKNHGDWHGVAHDYYGPAGGPNTEQYADNFMMLHGSPLPTGAKQIAAQSSSVTHYFEATINVKDGSKVIGSTTIPKTALAAPSPTQ